MDVRQAFGRRLRELRTAREFTQEELAARAGLHWTYVGGIERGVRNPALENITQLARALGVTLAQLFTPLNTPLAVVRRRRPRRTRPASRNP